ncbi:FAD-binding protein [Phenylobacterium sp. LjRoot225]|uniref:FAD-binding protein n=1 Tax=Phenylobacterium sp. LjRoot225 TaxID=3342285 RepID=UPI003ECD06C8
MNALSKSETATTAPSGQGPLQTEYDLVIVGSGGGSMCAALAAQQAGKSAVILEKRAKVGGSTSLSGGVLWVPNHPLLAKAGVHDDIDEARLYLDHVVGADSPGSTPQRREAFLRTAPQMLRFLMRLGLKLRRPLHVWPDYRDDLPGGLPEGRSVMPVPFDVKKLGAWYPRIAVYTPVIPIPLGSDEFGTLLLLKRTLAGKLKALKLVWLGLRAKFLGEQVSGCGSALQGRMLEIALRQGLAPYAETPVKDLIVEGGRVTGVVAEHEGRRVEVRARCGVLIDAGGFSRNADLRRKYARGPISDRWTSANRGDTGDLLEVLLNLDAASAELDTAWWVVTSHNTNGEWPPETRTPDGDLFPFQHHLDLSLPHVMLVDQDGKRFCDESGSYMDIGERMYARHAETGRAIPAWAIFDARHRQRYAWGPLLPGTTPQQWIDSGYMKKADTLDELAQLCGVDPAGLKAEAQRFSGFARTGVDLDYNRGGRAFDRSHGDPTVKPNPCLGAIEQGPFYAVAIYPGDVGTAGGVITDEHARVLRKDGSAIPGLYACGNFTAPVFGRTYPGAGASIAASFTFGYIAARHCAGAGGEA